MTASFFPVSAKLSAAHPVPEAEAECGMSEHDGSKFAGSAWLAMIYLSITSSCLLRNLGRSGAGRSAF